MTHLTLTVIDFDSLNAFDSRSLCRFLPTAPHSKVVKVSDIAPGTVGHNFYAKVLSVEAKATKARLDGTAASVAECLIGDETGSIILTARNGAHRPFVAFIRVVVIAFVTL